MSRFRKPNDNGMLVLYEPEGDSLQISYDVILVHGLRGHRIRSFTHENGVCWPKDLLPLNRSDIRVMSWGWDSRGIRYEPKSANFFEDHALALLADINIYRPNLLNNRPIIFIAHSIGGNIVKEALLTSANQTLKFGLCYGSIIFLGTPHHQGLKLVTYFRLYRHLPGISADPWTEQLREDSDWLEKQTQRFNEDSNLCDLRSWSFYETISVNMPFYKKVVVDQSSATLGQPKQIVRPLDSDHFNLNKFPNENDANYLRVQDAINSWNRWRESEQREIHDSVNETDSRRSLGHHSIENHEPAADSTMNLDDAAPAISVIIHHSQVERSHEKKRIVVDWASYGSDADLARGHSTPAASVALMSTSKTPPLYNHTDDKMTKSLRSENSQVLQASKELGTKSLDPRMSITDTQALKVKSSASPSSIGLTPGSMKALSDKVSSQSSHLTNAEGIAIGASSIAGVNLLTNMASAYTSRQALEQSRISTKASTWSANISAATYAMNKDKIEHDERRNKVLTSSSSNKITIAQSPSSSMTVVTSLAKVANYAPPEIIFPSVPKNKPIRRDSRDSDDSDRPTGTFAYTNDGTAMLQTNGQDTYSLRTMDSSKENPHILKTSNSKEDISSPSHSNFSIYWDSQDTTSVPHVKIPPSRKSSSKFKPPNLRQKTLFECGIYEGRGKAPIQTVPQLEKTQRSSNMQESQVTASTVPEHIPTGKDSISPRITDTSGPTLIEDESTQTILIETKPISRLPAETMVSNDLVDSKVDMENQELNVKSEDKE
ncbi:hypothetical protein DID88_006992 [Monilinia fructigena]|uniref:DUF676 domain-containing protein n=1 Tax=Monilinia fructigena TaxID=38457 RepID=A0A395IIJ6_9HELO|nr:hypothetical protein DID88_006992 [Monilinia fructigena]